MSAGDVLIKGGMVYDGSGKAGRVGDVLIAGDRIAGVGKLDGAKAGVTIDARGKAVCPGFVDPHTHSDYASLEIPLAESRVFAGVTTELTGHCGGSAFPLRGEARKEQTVFMSSRGIDLDWEEIEGYFAKSESVGYSVNRAALVGHGTIRASVIGYAQRKPTGEELERMKDDVRHVMEAGGFGLSAGLIYPPGCYAETEEVAALCGVAAEYGGFYEVHMRSEASQLIEAVEEQLRIARESGVRTQIAHLKANLKPNWHKIDQLEEVLRRAIEDEGLDVTADRYPYICSETGLGSVLPHWAHDGGTQRTVERLQDPETRERIRVEIEGPKGDKGDWGRIAIGEVQKAQNKRYEGMTLPAVAEAMGVSCAEAAFRLYIEEAGQVSCVFEGMCEENLRRILSWPFVMVGSDSSVMSAEATKRRGRPHPRAYGTTTRVLGKYAREEGVLTMAEAVRKLSGQPAERIGLKARGLLKKGYYADVVVFDETTVIDRATYKEPHQYPAGIETVIVNGVLTLQNGTHTGAKAGRMLKR